MNLIEQAQQAYAPANMPIQSARSIEATVLSKITAKLNKAAQSRQKDYPKFIAALHENRQIWTALAVDVADDDNALPRSLRAQIFYLAEFTEIHSKKIIQSGADVEALISINTSILRGLNAMEAV